jgi:ABC-type ATPase with predicted acetyltransferase domain
MSNVGLDPDTVCLKRFGQLSEGEKFRAEVAMNLKSDMIFDEFTSMVDRTVAETVSKGLKEIAEKEKFKNITLCSCHKDFIKWVMPDLIVDLDDFAVYHLTGTGTTAQKDSADEMIGTIDIKI